MAIELSSENFEEEVINSTVPVLVDFWGPRCGPCLELMPKVEELETKYGDTFKVSKVDASKNRRMCLNLKVLGLPTFLIYKNGQELERLKGDDLTIEAIEDAMKEAL